MTFFINVMSKCNTHRVLESPINSTAHRGVHTSLRKTVRNQAVSVHINREVFEMKETSRMKSEWYMRVSSKHKFFWRDNQALLNELTPSDDERKIIADIIESFWECHGEIIGTHSPSATEWRQEIKTRLPEYLDYEEEKCSKMLESIGKSDGKKTMQTILSELTEINEEVKSGLDKNEVNFQKCMSAYWASHHQHWLVFLNRFIRWRDAFRYLVEHIYCKLVKVLDQTSLDNGDAKKMLNSQRNELIDKSYNARNWNVVFEDLLEDCLNFPDESCKSSYSPDWGSEHLALEQILGKGWMRYRQNLLSQAHQCSSWRTLFISLLESVSLCLSESDSNAQRQLGEFKRRSDNMMSNLLENSNIDQRTAEFMRVTVAEILRFNSHTIRVSGAAELLRRFCEYQLSGAVFSDQGRSDQRSILRMHSEPTMNAARSVVSLTHQISVPATTYMSTPEKSYIPTNIEIQQAEIKSNADLLLRTKLSQEGKTIIFSDKRIEPAFKSAISVHFPSCSVLAEEKICLEIIPESIVKAYNEEISKEKTKENKSEAKGRLITPILHVDRENDAPFLRTVNVTLPLLGDVTYKSGETKIAAPGKLTVTEGTVKVAAIKFSPVAVAEVNKILRPLKLDRDFNYSFDELGVYLLSEQFENRHFRMDLRKFSDWQEHRRFRMDESKWLILVISPRKIQPGDIDKKVEAHLRDPITIRNDWESQKIILGNRVVFYFPDAQLPPDATNVRNMTLNSNRECQQFPLKLEYETKNLKDFAISELLFIPYHSEDRINYFLHVRVPNSENIMMRLLQLLGENWLEFLDRYLKLDIQGLFEFLSNDIRDTFPTERLHWVSQNVQGLREICIRRKFVIHPTSQHSEDVIEDIFSNFRTALEMGRAKREICDLLLSCGIIPSNAGFTDNLLERNRKILAAALMYIPMGTMKHAIRQAFDANLLPIDVVLRNFVNDGVPEGDRL